MPHSTIAARFVLSIVLALAVPIAEAQTGQALTNEDIVKMVKAQLSESIILTTIESSNPGFDVSPEGLIALKNGGVNDRIIEALQRRVQARDGGTSAGATRGGPEKSDQLAASRDPDVILRSFKTMLVNASDARYFKTDQMKGALGRNKDFVALKISIVDDPSVADVVLDVGYTFAWDFPFALKHQNTSVVLVSGKGTGPFSGPKGAASVASELAKALKPYRTAPAPSGRRPAQ